MSLLMDALRKAEEAKRAAGEGSEAAPEAAAATHDPVFAAGIPAELALEPQSVPAARASEQPAATKQAQRDSINNVFAAKAGSKRSADRAFMVALISVAGLALLGIGVYIWWQMQPRSALAPVQATAVAPVSAPAAQASAPLPAAPPTAAPAESSARGPLAAVAETLANITAADRPAARPTAEAPAPGPIRITHSRPRVSPLLEQGYAALQQGNLSQAQQAYEQMLASDPKNIDALYGLAAIAVHRQQPILAEDYYLRILEADPRDALAHAGLAGLKGRSGGAESRIKTLIAEQPNVAQLHFALGNLYALDQRWRDAQQAYFQAYKNDSENPDAAFNLAVSLDQLHQEKLAAQYYGEALRLAAARPAAFNREQVRIRLRDLQGSSAP
jgi:tetratricopeptide (TPR) repeat protein